MTPRHPIIVSGCAAAALVVVLALAPFIGRAWHPSPQPLPASASMHGSFADRFEPKLEGIGSTRELPPVHLLDGVEPAKERRPARPRQTH